MNIFTRNDVSNDAYIERKEKKRKKKTPEKVKFFMKQFLEVVHFMFKHTKC
jgi:hypothetical protein